MTSQPPTSATAGLDIALPTSRVGRCAWWALVCLLPLITIFLFVPWSSHGPGPSVDLRPELVWSSVGAVVLGAIALAFPNRWLSYAAALPTLGALTDLGPVFLPETGQYPWTVKAVVVMLALVGVAWITLAMGYPAREQQTRWIVAPVAGALTLATLWLPWVIISGIGQESGRATAYDVLFSTYATAASGVVATRLAILVLMFLGVIGAVLPLLSRTAAATKLAMGMTLTASILIVLLGVWLSVRGDGVQLADHATGPRIALAGFTIITLVWSSRLKAAGSSGDDALLPRRIDDSGFIPVIMTGQPAPQDPPNQQITSWPTSGTFLAQPAAREQL